MNKSTSVKIKSLRWACVFVVMLLLCGWAKNGLCQERKLDHNAIREETQKVSKEADTRSIVRNITKEYWWANIGGPRMITFEIENLCQPLSENTIDDDTKIWGIELYKGDGNVFVEAIEYKDYSPFGGQISKISKIIKHVQTGDKKSARRECTHYILSGMVTNAGSKVGSRIGGFLLSKLTPTPLGRTAGVIVGHVGGQYGADWLYNKFAKPALNEKLFSNDPKRDARPPRPFREGQR